MPGRNKSNVIHIDSRNPIDCADDIGTVVNAVLGGEFALHEDGTFTLDPWAGGLTVTGQSFMGFVEGRRFSNLTSVLAVIMDIQVEAPARASSRQWIGHMVAARTAIVVALGGDRSIPYLPERPRLNLRAMQAARAVIPYCLRQVSEENASLIILNRDYMPVGTMMDGRSDPRRVDYEDFNNAHIRPDDPAFKSVTDGLKITTLPGHYWFFDDLTHPRDTAKARALLEKIEAVLRAAMQADRKG